MILLLLFLLILLLLFLVLEVILEPVSQVPIARGRVAARSNQTAVESHSLPCSANAWTTPFNIAWRRCAPLVILLLLFLLILLLLFLLLEVYMEPISL